MVSQHRLRGVKFSREIPFRLEAPTNREGESILFCSAVTQPVFAWSSIKIPAILLRTKSSTWIPCVTGLATSGMCGCQAFPRVNSTVIGSRGRIYPKRAIASTRTSCFWIRMQEQLQASRIGIFSAARGYDVSSRLTDLSFSTVDDAGTSPKCIFIRDHFDWEMDSPPKHSASDTVIYETHVRGFTIHPSSGVAHPGTFAGLTEKIPYLQDLGVTAIELMPVFEFNENESQLLNPITGRETQELLGL